MQEFRKDPLTDRWVIICPDRARRPTDFPPVDPLPALSDDPTKKASCPFCPGHENQTPSEIIACRPATSPKDGPGWTLRVVPNKFPALSMSGDEWVHPTGMFEWMDGVGAHEVIIETPEHNQSLATLPVERVADVLRAFRDRILDLRRDPRIRYVMIFKNHGGAAAATLQHPHSQLIALPIMPPQVREELRGAKEYFQIKERCIFCDIIQQEIESSVRMVDLDDDYVTLAPYASRFPFEVCILPRRHGLTFAQMPGPQYESLAKTIRSILAKLNRVLNHRAYNLLIHDSPVDEAGAMHYHWHIEIMPKLTKVGGFEWGSGFFINPTPPEDAARQLRDADAKWDESSHESDKQS